VIAGPWTRVTPPALQASSSTAELTLATACTDALGDVAGLALDELQDLLQAVVLGLARQDERDGVDQLGRHALDREGRVGDRTSMKAKLPFRNSRICCSMPIEASRGVA
jgi:hypothetical protein